MIIVSTVVAEKLFYQNVTPIIVLCKMCVHCLGMALVFKPDKENLLLINISMHVNYRKRYEGLVIFTMHAMCRTHCHVNAVACALLKNMRDIFEKAPIPLVLTFQ